MGKKAQEIVELDLKDLIADLNKAYCDEWLAYYAWWYMAQVVKGKGYVEIAEMLNKIAKDELEHATEVAQRITELGGLPTNNPANLEKDANEVYPGVMKDPSNYDEIIKIVTAGEADAIEVYNNLAKKTFGKDYETYRLVTHILGEEIKHEEMFENLKN